LGFIILRKIYRNLEVLKECR